MSDLRDHYWIVAGDETQIYASARAAFVAADDASYLAWVELDGFVTRIGSAAELTDVLIQAGIAPGPALPVTRHGVMTYTIVRRLEDAGKAVMALAALDADPVAKIKFQTTRWIWSDDSTANGMIAAVGADPAAVLAFDSNWRPGL